MDKQTEDNKHDINVLIKVLKDLKSIGVSAISLDGLNMFLICRNKEYSELNKRFNKNEK